MGRQAVVYCHSFGWGEREKDKIPRMARLRKRCTRFVDAVVPRSRAGVPSIVLSTDNEEKLGDGLETVLGFFDVISYFGEELPKCRPMLEATFLKFVRENRPLT